MNRNRPCSKLKGITFLHVCSHTKTSKSYDCKQTNGFLFLADKELAEIDWHSQTDILTLSTHTRKSRSGQRDTFLIEIGYNILYFFKLHFFIALTIRKSRETVHITYGFGADHKLGGLNSWCYGIILIMISM